MIPCECKRLAEVDFPIAEVSRHAVSENPNRNGHPFKLHKWWARRPLASSRAVLLALLLPDPCDPACPDEFSALAVRRLKHFAAHINNTKVGATRLLGDLRSDLRSRKEHKRQAAKIEARRRSKAWRRIGRTTVWKPECVRAAMIQFLATGASWEFAADEEFLSVARDLIAAAHTNETPLVVDPFAGGGSIPLEALRLGCETFASDLNPVAGLILKAMLEDIPRHGVKLADELQSVRSEMSEKTQELLADLYPADSDGATPIAYLWARTIRCEAPNCGAEIPLIRSFWLCQKPKRKWALRPRVLRSPDQAPMVRLDVHEPTVASQVPVGTVSRAKATCLCCHVVVPPQRVRAQLTEQRGGADVIFDAQGFRTGGAMLVAVATLKPGDRRRHYRSPTREDYANVWKAQRRLKEFPIQWKRDDRLVPFPVPDEPLPLMSGTFNVPLYGMNTWGDLFTARQKVAIGLLVGLVRGGSLSQLHYTSDALALSLGKLFRHCNTVSKWHRGSETVAGAFALQAIPMSWDFPEMYPLAPYAGGLNNCLDDLIACVTEIAKYIRPAQGHVEIATATDHPLPDQAASVWFTDPPYYFAIPYADLSDFFFVWLRRLLPGNPIFHNSRFSDGMLTPKDAELCEMAHWDQKRYGHKDKVFFENGMAEAFAEGRRVLGEDGIGAVVFAHKTTEGWAALLSGIIRGGWTIAASWPIATERAARLRARESAALATSVHLICRPRPDDAPVGDWADVLRELPNRVSQWIDRLQGEGVRGADLVFACIGPALEIFSRYRAVETPDGTVVGLSEYLERVWEVVGRTALKEVLGTAEAKARNGDAGVLEEDARLTALFLWTLQSTLSVEADEGETVTRFSLPFDVVRRFAQPMGIDLDAWTDRIIGQSKGIVRLLPVTKRAKQLLGEDTGQNIVDSFGGDLTGGQQQNLFPDLIAEPGSTYWQRSRALLTDDAGLFSPNATTLDRVHAAMLFQSRGATYALTSLVQAERERGPQFLRLANALSALYPRGSEEKRLLDAMLVAVPNR